MKKLIIFVFFGIFLLFSWSCQRRDQVNITEMSNLQKENIYYAADNNSADISFSFSEEENFDWLTEHTWIFESGHWYPTFNFLIFRKLNILPESVFYQQRLRNEWFTLMYHMEERDNLFLLDSTNSAGVLNIEFRDNYSHIRRFRDGISMGGGSNRVGQQENLNYPLVGIWGELPALLEYRIVDPIDSVYYMEITEPEFGVGLPGRGVRMGTYLLRQIGYNIFETVSSFPDGRFRLEIMHDRVTIILTPLFELPDSEEGSIASFYRIVQIMPY
jgi:hypothetical protein